MSLPSVEARTCENDKLLPRISHLSVLKHNTRMLSRKLIDSIFETEGVKLCNNISIVSHSVEKANCSIQTQVEMLEM